MNRGSLVIPLAGVVIAFVALLVWVSGVGWRSLDGIVLALFTVGLALSVVGYFFGTDATARRLSVIGIGVNSGCALLLAMVLARG